MSVTDLSASTKWHKRNQNKNRKLWSFNPRQDRKQPVKGLNIHNYSKIVDVYLSIEPKMRKILDLSRVTPWDQDDILQEIVTSALDKEYIRDYESWMIQALRFQIITYVRLRRKFRTRFSHVEPATLDLIKDTQLKLAIELEIEWSHIRLDIGKALKSSLTPRMQRLIAMKAGGYGNTEIGEATGYSVKSIRKLYWRGVESLRHYLEKSRHSK